MTEADWAPERQRVIDSAEAIKAIADPLWFRLLQLLMTSADRSWSVKEMAAALEQPVTKLYHHVKILESAGLITDVESRLVSGIVDTAGREPEVAAVRRLALRRAGHQVGRDRAGGRVGRPPATTCSAT